MNASFKNPPALSPLWPSLNTCAAPVLVTQINVHSLSKIPENISSEGFLLLASAQLHCCVSILGGGGSRGRLPAIDCSPTVPVHLSEVKLRPCGRSCRLLEHAAWQWLRWVSSWPGSSGVGALVQSERWSSRSAGPASAGPASCWRLCCWLWSWQPSCCVAGVLFTTISTSLLLDWSCRVGCSQRKTAVHFPSFWVSAVRFPSFMYKIWMQVGTRSRWACLSSGGGTTGGMMWSYTAQVLQHSLPFMASGGFLIFCSCVQKGFIFSLCALAKSLRQRFWAGISRRQREIFQFLAVSCVSGMLMTSPQKIPSFIYPFACFTFLKLALKPPKDTTRQHIYFHGAARGRWSSWPSCCFCILHLHRTCSRTVASHYTCVTHWNDLLAF